MSFPPKSLDIRLPCGSQPCCWFSSEMVSPYIKAELTAAVSSLGYTDGGIYYKDQYCLGKSK